MPRFFPAFYGNPAAMGGASFVGPLDAFTSGVMGLWSVWKRQLTSWVGPLIRVRRSGDNAEQDFGPVAATGIVDTAALLAWVIAGGGTQHGYVTTIYDQSGLSRNFIQPTASAQRRIVNAGAMETLDGKPVMRSTSTSQGYYTAAFTPVIIKSQFSSFVRGLLPIVGLADECRFLSAAGNTLQDYSYPNAILLAKLYNLTGLGAYANGVMGPLSQTFDASFVYSTVFTGANCVLTNSGDSATTTQSETYIFDRFYIGMMQPGVFYNAINDAWSDGIVYDTNKTTDSAAIRSALTV